MLYTTNELFALGVMEGVVPDHLVAGEVVPSDEVERRAADGTASLIARSLAVLDRGEPSVHDEVEDGLLACLRPEGFVTLTSVNADGAGPRDLPVGGRAPRGGRFCR